MVRFAKRIQAESMLLARWRRTISWARRVGLPINIPDWDRLRNYELEALLEEVLGGTWCVSEWCPFDGIFCRWADHAPQTVVDAKIQSLEANRLDLSTRINVDFYIATLRARSSKP